MMVSLTPKGDSLRHSIQKPVLINTGSIFRLHVSICELVSARRNILDQILERELMWECHINLLISLVEIKKLLG